MKQMKSSLNILIILVGTALGAAGFNLPDPLTSDDGKRIKTAREWMAIRRPELLELFRKNVYGRASVGRPRDMDFEVNVTPGLMEGAAIRKLVNIRYSGPHGTGAIGVVLFIPARSPRPAPCFVLICNRSKDNIDPTRSKRSPFWPAEAILQRGYATAAFQVDDIDPDRDDGFTNGVHGVFDAPNQRRPDAWGTIAAWAWGASRVMDYLEYDREIDSRRVAVVGHSRGGKTALWAGAEDERFAMVVSNDSGSTGAAISRIKGGERISAINQAFPHWFCANYKRYNDHEQDLPVDQHELLALIAPRLLYIASASEDSWADPRAEFQSAVEASAVYRLFHFEGFGKLGLPAPSHPMTLGQIGYHLRPGKHDLTEYDWECFMNFADKLMK